MKTLSKKTERERDKHAASVMFDFVVGLALLTADDVFGLDEASTEKFLNGFSENMNGYIAQAREEKIEPAKAVQKELAERGIEICFKGESQSTTPKPISHQRGIGEWREIETEDGKKKIVCSHCGKGTAAKRNYCAECGADMRGKKDA